MALDKPVLLLKDYTRLDPIHMSGEPQMVANEQRDVLKFEFDPNMYDVDTLDGYFSNPNMTETLSTKPTPSSTKITVIGVGYCIYLGTNLVTRIKPHEPGKMVRPEEETVIVCRLAQLTWDEYQNYLRGNWTHPEL